MAGQDDDHESLNMEERRKFNEGCNGAPKYFNYPKPLELSDEERQRYAEIDDRLPTPKRKTRRRRR